MMRLEPTTFCINRRARRFEQTALQLAKDAGKLDELALAVSWLFAPEEARVDGSNEAWWDALDAEADAAA